jgi:7-cyano-7-deazaguanine synthase
MRRVKTGGRRDRRRNSAKGTRGAASAGTRPAGCGRHLRLRRKLSVAIPGVPAKGPRTAVLLLSGGLDSATCLALLARWGWIVHAVSFDYGQRHRIELRAARRLARRYGTASHRVLRVPDLGAVGGSALTDSSVAIPKRQLGKSSIPVTYVPARNTVFLSLALAVAERTGATEIVIGANALDYSGYPDCRPPFLRAFERAARLGTKAGVEGRKIAILAPLLTKTKAEIVGLASALGLDPALTSSCYDPGPDGRPCGECDSCLLRERGFRAAGTIDPLTKSGQGTGMGKGSLAEGGCHGSRRMSE